MSSASVLSEYKKSHDLYDLTVQVAKRRTEILMSLSTPHLKTGSLPHAKELLEESLPAIFKTNCRNYLNLPFREEAKDTEIAHLFEHILLVNLCREKGKHSHFKGETRWRISKPENSKIVITAGEKDAAYLSLALERSMDLLNKILTHTKQAAG